MSPGVSAAGLSDEQILAEAQILDAAERERGQIRQTTSVYWPTTSRAQALTWTTCSMPPTMSPARWS